MQLRGALYYYVVSIKYTLMIFWMILGGILLLSLASQWIFGNGETNVYFSFSAPIYIFSGILAFWVVKNIIPYLIRLGSTRLNVFIATGIALGLVVIFNALLSNLLSTITMAMYGDFTGNTVVVTGQNGSVGFNHIGELIGENTWWSRFFIDLSVQLFFMSLSFIFGVIFYRYKLLGGGAILGVMLFILIYSISAGWLTDFALDLINNFSFVFFYQLTGIAIIIYLASILLIRKITV